MSHTDPAASVSVTDNVPVASAIKAARANIQPIVRNCTICDEPLPAGVVRHPQCRGWNV